MEISADLVKQLRDKTGISIMQCRKALEEAGGDIEKATAILKQNSALDAHKKEGRALNAGIVSSYIHTTGAVGTMVELLCETDFVARSDDFKNLARDIAMHIAAADPKFLKAEDIKDGAEGEALLNQPFIKNPEVTIMNLIESAIQKFGEKIEVGKFVRFSI